MYAGHLGVALAASRARPAVPLIVLMLASQGPDWLDAIGMTLGAGYDQTERWSHTIPLVLLGAALFGVLAWIRWGGARSAAVVALTYLAHLPADLLTGQKLLLPNGPRVGLDLYNHPAVDLALECAVVLLGWALYRQTLPARRRAGALAWSIPAALVLLQLGADLVFADRLGAWRAVHALVMR